AMSYFATGENPKKLGSAHSNLAPYQAFAGGDGEFFVIAIGNDNLWNDFCVAVGKTEWSRNPKFITNPDRVRNKQELVLLLETLFKEKPANHWINAARIAGVPVGPISKISDVFSDPQVIAREMITEIDNPRTGKKLRQLGTPVKFSKAKTSLRLPPPAQGENSVEILKELGYSKNQIHSLVRNGVVKVFEKER
ncbi:MAG: CoA transferase, partial [Thaumarchaeota archaeon]|nr:CoA transferase [Nitrososphaerota archaeon]